MRADCFFFFFLVCVCFETGLDLQELWGFVLRLNTAVVDKKVTSVSASSLVKGLSALLEVLNRLSTWIDEIPPIDQPMRFGNKAFRTWHSRLVEQAPGFTSEILEAASVVDGSGSAAIELAAYLDTSFGNETRIDYGTGHEAHFCLFLHLLEKVGVFGEPQYAEVVLIIFNAYLGVTRKLQTTYMLEPAGSHGVWGLDDYSFLPFLWGSSQLLNSTRVRPTVIDHGEELESLRSEYLYCDAVAFVKQLKKGPFHEHSPMLYDISRVRAGWPKINQGMLKMYRGEVWQKVPVMQGFLFGTLFPFPNDSNTGQIAASGSSPVSPAPGGDAVETGGA